MFAQKTADIAFKSLDAMHSGLLTVTTPDGKTRVFSGKEKGDHATITIKDWSVISNMARKGDIGFAEDYRDGKWETDNLVSLTSLGLENKAAFDRFVTGNKLARTVSSLSYLLRLNTVKGSKKNIHAHYDLGNKFYKLWLDQTMTYSAALYKTDTDSLEQAQHQKYDRMIECLNSKSGNLLEVGCGWGGFAERALDTGDFAIKGITLSEEQHAFANQRLNGKAKITLEDYRKQEGKFNNIISIEMFEAVGEKFWPTYFQKLSSLLEDKGKAVIQTITMNEQDFPRYRKGGDFIRSYIFPGGMLPSASRFAEEAAKQGLKTGNEFFFGQDYARTLEIWLQNFDANIDAVKAQGFDEKFIRLWRFYLAACIAGFKTERTNVMQVEVTHA